MTTLRLGSNQELRQTCEYRHGAPSGAPFLCHSKNKPPAMQVEGRSLD